MKRIFDKKINLRHPMGVLHLFSIKNIFYDKMDLRLLFSCDNIYFFITCNFFLPDDDVFRIVDRLKFIKPYLRLGLLNPNAI